MEEQFYTIVLRHDTSTMWLVNDPILSLGEYGVEDDTHKVKRGDGESKWSELTYEDFGLQYIVTFANLHGDLKDNETLMTEFDKKLSKNVFDCSCDKYKCSDCCKSFFNCLFTFT